ncbi:MAG: exodeoxyribonuclease VII small subunit [Candidatus Omnitrophica bacterium]|nr:exodeoxyribonuclease VII small subunit [Candidatus Omnitrophota bacterium]
MPAKKKTEFHFEKALEELQAIVEDLEGGELELEESLKKYESGIKLARACSEKLKAAQRKVEILTQDKSGELTEEPFEETDN